MGPNSAQNERYLVRCGPARAALGGFSDHFDRKIGVGGRSARKGNPETYKFFYFKDKRLSVSFGAVCLPMRNRVETSSNI